MSEESLHSIMKAISRISRRIDILTRMLALNLVKDIRIQKEKIVFLSGIGLANAQIATIIGTTSHTVKQRLYEVRRGLQREAKKGPSQAKVQEGGERVK